MASSPLEGDTREGGGGGAKGDGSSSRGGLLEERPVGGGAEEEEAASSGGREYGAQTRIVTVAGLSCSCWRNPREEHAGAGRRARDESQGQEGHSSRRQLFTRLSNSMEHTAYHVGR